MVRRCQNPHESEPGIRPGGARHQHRARHRRHRHGFADPCDAGRVSSGAGALVEDRAAQSVAWDRCRNYLVPTEVELDGSCPREEARTNSLGYSTMNLDAFSVLCRIAERNGVNLWSFKTPAGIGVAKAFGYLSQYLQLPDTWKKQQISKFSPDGAIFPGLAGLGLHSPELLAAYKA